MVKKSQNYSTVLPGQWLGLLGGGQLGRMFCHAAQAMGYHVMVLDPDADCPAGKVADDHICAAYEDQNALKHLAERCAAVTTEFENIAAESLSFLAQYTFVSPDSHAVAIAQNRLSEKQFLVEQGIQVAPFLTIESNEACEALLKRDDLTDFLPGLLKTAQFGYDGKGQIAVSTPEEIRFAFRALNEPCVLEKKMDLAFEVSLLIVRNSKGEKALYPLVENIHHQGILAVTFAPSVQAEKDLIEQAREYAIKIVDALNYVGVLCVEFFVLKDGAMVVNEIAPRPHNSGHYTMNACDVSQFEQQVRAMVGLPLGSVRQHSLAVMLNILGDVWQVAEQTIEPDWPSICEIPEAHLHLYGKKQARLGRKMGHINCVAHEMERAKEAAIECAHILNISNIRLEMAKLKQSTLDDIKRAAQQLQKGELVAFPTETVYGLGADARNPSAVAKIYQAKGRPADHPVIVHLPADSDPAYWTKNWTKAASKLAKAFWPGPLTMIVLRADHIPDAVSIGQDTIGLRCPSHPIAQALLSEFNCLQDGHCGVAAPSANLFGQISPTTAQHVQHAFPHSTLMILEGGASQVGIESTIIDLSREKPTILRPGHVSRQALAEVLGEPVELADALDVKTPRVSGSLKAHYAPRTPLFFGDMAYLRQWLEVTAPVALITTAQHVKQWQHHTHIHIVIASTDPEIYAHQLYQLLHELDAGDFEKILVEKIDTSEAWMAVNDRLQRASAMFSDEK